MKKAIAKGIKDLVMVFPDSRSKDIDFYITNEEKPIRTVDGNNSFKKYYIGMTIDDFKLIVIRKYIFGCIYIWKKLLK